MILWWFLRRTRSKLRVLVSTIRRRLLKRRCGTFASGRCADTGRGNADLSGLSGHPSRMATGSGFRQSQSSRHGNDRSRLIVLKKSVFGGLARVQCGR